MHSFISLSAFLTFFFAIMANVNAAASPQNDSPSKCDAQNILEACVESTTAILKSCPVQDWDCLCTHYSNVLTCYNNCPKDQGRHAVESSKVANCNAAKQFSTTRSSSSTSKPTATQTSGTADNADASQTSGGSRPTGTGPASETETPNAAPAMVASGVEMGLGGLAWMLIAGVGYLM
ncbi:hypothetical protein BDBG_02374 [Blastomyces gilchristii SLH14081]|uniref:GPI anchored serine-threonine rich protein n=1 Tax=Blastomyces gilchristii (strain SLH14081) TaxID=559298 RepID=A0A179UGF7_BLAGS|nr:uncharacterized protein BDBG_02374 [Blastomyces gilchristii SLH14081]OAT06091.1 hypothetical protein BDBG_02374 [Blastomyces gilchristii SLH14081]